jgi:antitoxin YefM
MNTITYSSARNNIAQTMEKVCDDHNPVIITRKAASTMYIINIRM